MGESCTVYCNELSLEKTASIARDYLDECVIEGTPAKWSSITLKGKRAELRLTPLFYTKRADRFTDVRYTTWMWLDDCPMADSDAKEKLLSHVEKCKFIIGVVAEPDFESDGRFSALMIELARHLDGVIFNGSQMIDAVGQILCQGE